MLFLFFLSTFFNFSVMVLILFNQIHPVKLLKFLQHLLVHAHKVLELILKNILKNLKLQHLINLLNMHYLLFVTLYLQKIIFQKRIHQFQLLEKILHLKQWTMMKFNHTLNVLKTFQELVNKKLLYLVKKQCNIKFGIFLFLFFL
jgi:hypothetical protein